MRKLIHGASSRAIANTLLAFNCLMVVVQAHAGVIFEKLGEFTGLPYPYGQLVQAADGAFYGTTMNGGIGYGSVYRATPEEGIQTIFVFPTNAAPRAGLLQGADGYLYGTTSSGGDYLVCGTIFRVSTNGEFTSLASLNVNVTGFQPDAPLILGLDGCLYGTSSQSVFKTTTNGTLSLVALLPERDNPNPPGPPLYPNGNDSQAAVVFARDGNFYGTANSGGDYNKGTVFHVTTNGTLSTLFSFDGPNGWGCTGPLIQATDGNLYGTAIAGGLNTNYNYYSHFAAYGYGTIFRVSSSGTFTRLFSFDGTNGIAPASGVIQASDGNLYGTTTGGGDSMWGAGTVFQLTTNGILTTLHVFTHFDGSYVWNGLIQAKDGRLYGIAFGGGFSGSGVFYRISVPMPPVVQPLITFGKSVTVSWKSVAGQSYQVQAASELSTGNWTNATSVIAATDGLTSTTLAIGASVQQFYRVVLLP